jgi:hypothetical protein
MNYLKKIDWIRESLIILILASLFLLVYVMIHFHNTPTDKQRYRQSKPIVVTVGSMIAARNYYADSLTHDGSFATIWVDGEKHTTALSNVLFVRDNQ